jgi:hypothetical protein
MATAQKHFAQQETPAETRATRELGLDSNAPVRGLVPPNGAMFTKSSSILGESRRDPNDSFSLHLRRQLPTPSLFLLCIPQ